MQWGHSQSDCNSIREKIARAEALYSIGQFYQVIRELEPEKPDCPEEKKSSFEIQAKNFIALDSLERADELIETLLNLFPLYESPPNAPSSYQQRVVDLKRKKLSTSVSSVSKKIEDIYKAPATVIVMTQEEIRRRGYIDLDQMFDDLPGFDVSRPVATNYSNIYQRGYRSNSTDRTIFMIDGIEDNDFWGNNSYWSRQIPISNVDRVEIIYGPASTMYGQNALVGVVNVITRQPSSLVKDKFVGGIRADAGYGSYQTKYGDLTIGAKLSKKDDVFLSVTGRVYQSNEMDLSRFPDYDYDLSFYDEFDYYGRLSNSLENLRKKFSEEELNTIIHTESELVQLKADSLVLTPYGRSWALQADRSAFAQITEEDTVYTLLKGRPIGYSNLLEQYFLQGRLQAGDFIIGYQYWNSRQGNTNFGNDNSRPGALNGSIWAPSQSTLFARYNRNLSSKLVFSNIAQFRVNTVGDSSRLISLRNYSNGSLSLFDLVNEHPAGWYAESFFQRSRQFRNEARVFYSPNRFFDLIGGMEYRFSDNQKDYIRTADSLLSTVIAPESNIVNGEQSNQIDIQNLGIFLQGTYSWEDDIDYKWLHLTFGGRYDLNRFGYATPYEGVFNPRLAIIYTPRIGKANPLEERWKREHLYIKGIYARAFQIASSRDRYAIATPTRLLNNPDLEPEIANNLELVLGYEYTNRWHFEASIFSSKYEGLVSQIDVQACEFEVRDGLTIVEGPCESLGINGRTITTGQNQNVGVLEIVGLQSTFSYQINRHLSIYGNYTYTNPQGDNPLASEPGATLVRVADIAAHHFNAGGNLSLYDGGLNINLRMNAVGERPVGKGPDGRGTTVPGNPQEGGVFPPYAIFNGALTFQPGKIFPASDYLDGLQIQGVINNILNTEYFHPGIRGANGTTLAYRTPQPDRNFLLRLIYDFN